MQADGNELGWYPRRGARGVARPARPGYVDRVESQLARVVFDDGRHQTFNIASKHRVSGREPESILLDE